MGRRSFISSSAIRSMVSAYNRSKREKEFENFTINHDDAIFNG